MPGIDDRGIVWDVSVVIPVKNEAARLGACLDGILSQTVPVREIIVIDSGSTDGTQELARSYDKVRLVQIEPKDFNHGETRNLGVREAMGEFVVLTVGDARPIADDWIAQLLAGFVADDVVAVSGAQAVPESSSTNPLMWFSAYSKSEIRVYRYPEKAAFEAADPLERRSATAFDDVSAIYRRSALIGQPFRRLLFGEDVYFARDALLSGKAIAYNPAARVYHYHNDSFQTALKRTVVTALLRHEAVGYVTEKPDLLDVLLRGIVRLMRNSRLDWRQKLHWTYYNGRNEIAIYKGSCLFQDALKNGQAGLKMLSDEYSQSIPVPVKNITQ